MRSCSLPISLLRELYSAVPSAWRQYQHNERASSTASQWEMFSSAMSAKMPSQRPYCVSTVLRSFVVAASKTPTAATAPYATSIFPKSYQSLLSRRKQAR